MTGMTATRGRRSRRGRPARALLATMLGTALGLSGLWLAVDTADARDHLGAHAGATDRARPGCGSVVTRDVVLHRDLTCSADGLRVTRAGVTVDLDGHRIRGGAGGTGISVQTDDSAPVTITDGTIRGFDQGVLAGASTTVRGLVVRGATSAALRSQGPAYVRVVRSALTTSPFGVDAGALARLRVTGSRFVADGIALSLREDTVPSVVLGSSFLGNDRGLVARQSDRTTVRASRFSGNGTAIEVYQSRRSRLVGNTVDHNVAGLVLHDLETQDNLVLRNSFVANTTFGAHVGDAQSVITGTRVVGNLFSRNGAAGLWFEGGLAADGSSIADNRALHNGSDPGQLVDENGAPLDDGLHVVVPPGAGVVTLTGNVARRNAGCGIEATGVVDGGGNVETDNGAGPCFTAAGD